MELREDSCVCPKDAVVILPNQESSTSSAQQRALPGTRRAFLLWVSLWVSHDTRLIFGSAVTTPTPRTSR